MSAYDPYYGAQAPMASGTSLTAIFALIIAVIAIVVIIVVAYIVVRDRGLITNLTSQWSVVAGSTSNNTFDGSPNSVYIVPSGVPANFQVTVTPYTNISTFVTATATTAFRIDNTQNANPVTLTPATNVAMNGPANANVVPAHSVYEYQWVSTTTFRAISWSVGSV